MFVGAVPKWDIEADVVVLGAGVAGCVSAMLAYDGDPSAKVVILEKQPERYTGGNSRAAGGSIYCPRDKEKLITFRKALDAPNVTPEPVVRAWAEEMVQLEGFLTKWAADSGLEFRLHGVSGFEFSNRVKVEATEQEKHDAVREHADLPGSDVVEFHSDIAPRPSGVWKTFHIQVQKRPIEMFYKTAASELIQSETGEVRGVVATRDGRPFYVKARRGVCLCTGGFEANQQMWLDFWGLPEVYTVGTPSNTGDGIKMLMKAGADLWHMRNPTHLTGFRPGMKVPGFDSAFERSGRLILKAKSWIDVAKDGRRFGDEGRAHDHHYKHKVNNTWFDNELSRVTPVHMIFDEKTRLADTLASESSGWNLAVENYEWSMDNSVEVEKGWIIKAGSIRELAGKIGLDPVTLESTVATYNGYARDGRDPEFDRPASTMLPIDQAPYYAMRIVPYVSTTQGGGRRNEKAQVLNPDGRPIPRLFEAGELGSTYGNLFHYGSTLAEAISFGRIAGRNVVKERPWE